jgi:hypothetical protein
VGIRSKEMKKILSFVFVGLLASQLCFAAGGSRITLNDGTTIYGKVVGMADGVYKIQTETMGEISVNSDNVVEITSGNSSKKPNIGIIDGSSNNNRQSYPNYSNNSSNQGNSNSRTNNYADKQQDVNTMVQSLMMDENYMNKIMQLGTSEEMQSILNDPEVMEAIQSGDYDFLMNNPKMNDLMNSSGIQDILGGMN